MIVAPHAQDQKVVAAVYNVKPTIKVTSFKESGKYYSEHKSTLSDDHIDLAGYKLSQLIRNNDPSVFEYAGLTSGFNGEFYYIIEVDYGDLQNFCFFCLDRIHDKTRDNFNTPGPYEVIAQLDDHASQLKIGHLVFLENQYSETDDIINIRGGHYKRSELGKYFRRIR